MPQPAAALSITNMMNPHLFFLHPCRSCSPATSLFDLLNLEEESLPQNQQRVRKERLERNKEARRKAVEKMLTARKKAAGTAPGISAQLAEREVQPRDRAGLAKALLNRRRATKAFFRSSPSVVSYFSEFHFFYFSSCRGCTFLVLLDKVAGG